MASDEVPQEYLCPISTEIMKDPVVDAHGDTYERATIAEWYARSDKSPLSGVRLSEAERRILLPNRVLKNQIQDWLEKHPQARDDDTAPVPDQRQQHTGGHDHVPAPDAPRPTAREVVFHEAQRHEMHWHGRRWYHALPAATRQQWDALQLGTTCSVASMLELMGEDFGEHGELFIKALGDLDGDGVLTPDEMHALMYISANSLTCGICEGPIVMLHGATCFDCTREPLLSSGGGRAWVCSACVEEGGRRNPRWGGMCYVTGKRHILEELMDIRTAFQLKLSSGVVEEQIVRSLAPLDTFQLDMDAMLGRIGNPRRVAMLRAALGLSLNVDFEDEEGWTPLHVAALCGHSDAIRYLVLLADQPEDYARKVMRTLAMRGMVLGVTGTELIAARQDIQDALDEHRRRGDN